MHYLELYFYAEWGGDGRVSVLQDSSPLKLRATANEALMACSRGSDSVGKIRKHVCTEEVASRQPWDGVLYFLGVNLSLLPLCQEAAQWTVVPSRIVKWEIHRAKNFGSLGKIIQLFLPRIVITLPPRCSRILAKFWLLPKIPGKLPHVQITQMCVQRRIFFFRMICTDCLIIRVPTDVCLCLFIEGKGKQVDLSMSPTLIVTDSNWEDICETQTDPAKAGPQAEWQFRTSASLLAEPALEVMGCTAVGISAFLPPTSVTAV